MNTQRLVLAGFIACVIPLVAAARPTAAPGTSIQTPTPATPARTIEIKAKKYEFTPGTIDVALNELVRFKITAEDTEHGFEIEGVKDSCVEIPKGETKTVDYKATKAGTIAIKCCHRCGLGHGGMKGKITVK